LPKLDIFGNAKQLNMYVYPQIFALEQPNFTLALKPMPSDALCGSGNPGTGQAPPCTDCPEKMPFTPQDVFDIQWSVPIIATTIRLPNGSTVPSAGIINVDDRRLRISFCAAPPCFTVELNNECTFLAFERVACYEDCETVPSPDTPAPIPIPPQPVYCGFLQVEHWVTRPNGTSVGRVVVTNNAGTTIYTNAQYDGTLCASVLPNFPTIPPSGVFSVIASNAGAAGGQVGAYRLAGGTTFRAEIITGIGDFMHWELTGFDTQTFCDNPNGVCTNDDTPVILSGSLTSYVIEFQIKSARQYYLKAWFNPLPTWDI
jgi:hypothetical protein